MGLLVFLLLVGLLFGLGGMFTAAKWLLIFAVVFWLIGAFSYRGSRV
jgi:hypothetical protein